VQLMMSTASAPSFVTAPFAFKSHRKREVAVEGSNAKHELFSQPLGSDNSARRQAHPCEAEPTLLDLYSRVLMMSLLALE
jgi:hypothetical protein